MYSATVQLSNVQFQPIGSGNTTCTISPPQDISPNAPSGVFGGDGNTITITPPKGYSGSVQLIYQLPDPDYVLLGIAFPGCATEPTRQEFRSVGLNWDLTGSQMVVTDTCIPTAEPLEFEYDILIQQISSGAIGIIDPRIINEPDLP